MSKIGIVIRKYRVTQEIDQKDLAKEIGIKPAVLSRMEGGNDVSQDTVIKIINWLFTDQETASKQPDLLSPLYGDKE
jgi:predicted transcriptional regulator